MTMAAMGRGDHVIFGQWQAGTHGACFLSNRQVHRAVDETARVAFFRAFFEAADEIHLVQRFLQLFRRIGTESEGQVVAICGLRINLSGLNHGAAPYAP
jgi:hypothetical protein